jgi:hypothetical protein
MESVSNREIYGIKFAQKLDRNRAEKTAAQILEAIAAVPQRTARIVEPSPRDGDAQFVQAWILNEVLCEIMEGGTTESREIAARAVTHPRVKCATPPSDAAREALSRDVLIELIMRETTDAIVADGWENLGNPNVLVQGCRYIRRRGYRTNPTDGYENPEEAAKKFAGIIADSILALSAAHVSAWQDTVTIDRNELRRHVIANHVRLTSGGGMMPNGRSCKICMGEWADGAAENHALTCPLDGSAPPRNERGGDPQHNLPGHDETVTGLNSLTIRTVSERPDADQCDCENPEPASGVALVSEDCPIHGGRS